MFAFLHILLKFYIYNCFYLCLSNQILTHIFSYDFLKSIGKLEVLDSTIVMEGKPVLIISLATRFSGLCKRMYVYSKIQVIPYRFDYPNLIHITLINSS